MSGWRRERGSRPSRPGRATARTGRSRHWSRAGEGTPVAVDRVGAPDVVQRVADHRADAQDSRRVAPGRPRGDGRRAHPREGASGQRPGPCPGPLDRHRGRGLRQEPNEGSAGSSSSIRGRPPRTSDGGIAAAVTAAATRNSPTMIRAASRDGPTLERVDDERVAQRPVAERLRDELEVCVGRGVDLVAQAIDGRRAVRGQDGEPDRHADHPGDGHHRRGDAEQLPAGRLDRGRRSRGHGQPEAEPERAPAPGRPAPSRSSGVQADIASSPPIASARPTIVTRRRPVRRDEEPGDERADRRRARERPEGEALLVRSAVQHAVDEHRRADDGRREGVPGQQRHERGRR